VFQAVVLDCLETPRRAPVDHAIQLVYHAMVHRFPIVHRVQRDSFFPTDVASLLVQQDFLAQTERVKHALLVQGANMPQVVAPVL